MRDWFVAHYEVLKDFAGPIVSVVGYVLTAIIAIAGLKTFGRFKREKLEERRIEVAIDALAIAYEAQLVFEGIRSRGLYEHEYEEAYKKGEVNDQQRGPYSVLKRLQASSEFFDRVLKLEPRFVAMFGVQSEEYFTILNRARHVLEVTAQVLLEDLKIEIDPTDSESRERRRKWRVSVFASPGKVEPEDEVGKLLHDFRSRIEARCRPIVDREFGEKAADQSVGLP